MRDDSPFVISVIEPCRGRTSQGRELSMIGLQGMRHSAKLEVEFVPTIKGTWFNNKIFKLMPVDWRYR